MNYKEILKLNIKKTSSPITKKKEKDLHRYLTKYILMINNYIKYIKLFLSLGNKKLKQQCQQ